jgi:GT2 family glycosyltransferase
VRAVFRNLTPVRLLLVNQGDTSSMQQAMLEPWRNRWAVTIQDNVEAIPLSVVRTEAMRWAKNLGLEMLIILDDDMTVHSDAITNLVQAMDEHPEYHAIAGWSKQGNAEICAGGLIVEGNYYNLPVKPGVHPVDYVASGFTAIRLDPLIEYDTSYEMGWNDYDWCEIVKSRGGKLAVCGDAGAHHKGLLTGSGWKEVSDIANYRSIRYSDVRSNAMAEKFTLKWGFPPKNPKPLPEKHWGLIK